MKLFIAFLRLVRLPNLIFIVLTQLLFYYCIILRFVIPPVETYFTIHSFIYLVIASVLIAAAGYIINDYFDMNIDQVNKPEKLVVDKIIKRRWVILWHIFLSLLGVILFFYVDFISQTFWLGFTNLLCVFLLFAYSVTLKKKLLIGNVLISALTSWVILVVYLCYVNSFYGHAYSGRPDPNISIRFTRMTILYAGFAFVISLIREVIKDIEDMEGDVKFGCKTMPIVWGIPASKMFIAVWIIVLTGALGIVQFYVLLFGWWWSAIYVFSLIIFPLLWVLRKLYRAKTAKDFHRLSSVVKLVMFAGILSMLLLKIYS